MASIAFDMLEKQRLEALREAAALARSHDRRYKVIRYAIIVLSTIAAICAGLAFIDWLGFKIIAVITSTIVASALYTMEKTFGHKEKAKGYYEDSKRLEMAPIEYKANLGPYAQARTQQEKDEIYYNEVAPLISKWRTQKGLHWVQLVPQPVEVEPVQNPMPAHKGHHLFKQESSPQVVPVAQTQREQQIDVVPVAAPPEHQHIVVVQNPMPAHKGHHLFKQESSPQVVPVQQPPDRGNKDKG